uniref:Ovule protein n=1 Tax=Haemonchus placei TaxID=6290 RepID=A0A0N4WF60_HAEPC
LLFGVFCLISWLVFYLYALRIRHLPVSFSTPLSQRVQDLKSKSPLRSFLLFSSGLNHFPFKEFCRNLNKRYSDGAMSGLYGGCGMTSHPSVSNF